MAEAGDLRRAEDIVQTEEQALGKEDLPYQPFSDDPVQIHTNLVWMKNHPVFLQVHRACESGCMCGWKYEHPGQPVAIKEWDLHLQKAASEWTGE
jgi:hypothetical protein